MLNVFWWFLTVEAIGLAAFPLAYYLLPKLADRGYSVSKPLGILLIAYVSWILGVLHILPSIRLTIIGLLLVMGGLSGWYAWRHRGELKAFVIRERKAIIAAEAVFIVFFVGWTIFRAFDPGINHTEQPMDYAFLNASIETTIGQPEDPWLRGESISYYYFGYWIMGTITKITGIPSNITFNLSLALIPAMAAMGVFGLVFGLIRADSNRWTYALIGGLCAAFLLGVVANLEGVLEFMRANGIGSQGFWDWVRIDGLDGPAETASETWAPQEFWWWFRATRVINTFDGDMGLDYTIQEFPFFSFILGDFHPHVASIPFVVMFLAFAWNFLKSPVYDLNKFSLHNFISILAMGLILGCLAFTNMWDLPTYAALFLSIAALKVYRDEGGGVMNMIKGTAPVGIIIIGLAFVFCLPYFLAFRGGVTGIGAVDVPTRPIHMFLIWALFLVSVVPFILATFWQTTIKGWRRISVFALIIGFLPFVAFAFLSLQDGGTLGGVISRFFRILPFALLIAIAVYNTLWLMNDKGPTGKVFAMILAALGLMMIMGPELLFVRDSFNTRMNTIFKLYYQSWLLLSAASGFAIYYWISLRPSLAGWRRFLTTAWAAAFALLLLASLYYPPAAAATKGELNRSEATLDGLYFLRRSQQAEYDAIMFLRATAEPDSGMVEAVGEWFDNGLISRSTGIPTVFNWPGHQLQWRGGTDAFDGREADIARIYQTQDIGEAQNLLEKYDVEYVYVGPRERTKYGVEGLEKFMDTTFMVEVFSRDDVVIYKRNI
jgi:YYY domain-containing protein